MNHKNRTFPVTPHPGTPTPHLVAWALPPSTRTPYPPRYRAESPRFCLPLSTLAVHEALNPPLVTESSL
eukprot:3433985-Rhodomonas_salina.1